MKSFIKFICICAICISCNTRKQESEIIIEKNIVKIPSVFKNKQDASFKLKNGVLYFDEIPFSGTVEDFYLDEKLKSKSEYYQGKRQGSFFGWYNSGAQWFQRFYTNGLKSGIHKGWHKKRNTNVLSYCYQKR